MRRPGLYLFAAMLTVVCLALPTTLAFAKTNTNKTIVTYPSAFAVSQPVADLPVDFLIFPSREMPEPRPSPNKQAGSGQSEDPVLQKETLQPLGIAKGIDFDGLSSNGFAPSDNNMAIGPTRIVETANVEFAIYNKSGTIVAGPTNIQNLFAPLAGDCSSSTDGDPVTLYDRAADRWLISMIGVGSTFSECIAVSKTNDPTGAYFLFGYSFGNNLNDYPKLSTWATASNSAYLATYDIFVNGAFFGGSDLCGLDRTKLLAGDKTAAQLCKETPSSEFSYLPSDMDGPTPPVDGTPGLFINHHNGANNRLFLRTLALNFASGTATLSSAKAITVATYTEACHSSCVPQSGGGSLLDALGDLQMYRFAVRHFPDHDRAVLNNSVIVSGSQVGVRWYELFDPAGSVTLNQQGTYAPDSSYRWMASAAEDQNADIAIGYSASSSSIHPAVRVAGRVPSDPAGSLESEVSIIEGAGSQTGLSRWGDYSAMQVDPSDDCTFWYVQQYEAVSGSFNWHTRIGSFAFSGCGGGGGPIVSLSATKLTFAKTPIGQTSPTKSVTLTNTGSATLNISSITISGDFAIKTNTCGAQVQPGANCKVTMAFTPTAAGARHGTLSFTDDAPGSPQTVALSGTGESIALSPNPVNYGTVVVGQSSTMAVTVKNVGPATVSLTGFSITGETSDFSITANTCGGTIAPGATCSISVKFAPTVKGKRSGKLNVFNNGGGSDSTDKLVGTGG